MLTKLKLFKKHSDIDLDGVDITVAKKIFQQLDRWLYIHGACRATEETMINQYTIWFIPTTDQ